ncbi:MAG TPA: hypothetical protein VK659_22290, partial [Asanoa sp.]|nr:hypothetical protein [Asanoa sp.]
MTTTPTMPPGLGEPRGPEYVSPDLDLIDGEGRPPVGGKRRSFSTARWRRAALAVAAVIVVAAISGGLAGGYVAREQTKAGAQPSPSASGAVSGGGSADLIAAAGNTLKGVVSIEVRAADGSVSGGSGFAIDANQNIVTNDHTLGSGEPRAIYLE